jgi:hypothetical protein
LLANRVDQSLLMRLTHPVRQQAGSYRFDAWQAEPKVRQRVGRFRCSGERLRQPTSRANGLCAQLSALAPPLKPEK